MYTSPSPAKPSGGNDGGTRAPAVGREECPYESASVSRASTAARVRARFINFVQTHPSTVEFSERCEIEWVGDRPPSCTAIE